MSAFDRLVLPPLQTVGLPGIGGSIKQSCEDFEVEEIPAYAPAETGEFLFLWVEKRDMGADYFQRQVARRLGIRPNDIGVAGLKDRRAVTRQMISVPAAAFDRLPALEGEGIRLLETHRHTNKLRPGHLHGNRFKVLIRDVQNSDSVEPILDRLRNLGIPNFYGPQRFGRNWETLQLGVQLLRDAKDVNRKSMRNPFMRKLALSAVQAALFNDYLGQRIANGLFLRVLNGDVMGKWPFGGMFIAEDLPHEQMRFDIHETVHMGPIFGRKTFPAKADAAEREAAVLHDAEIAKDAFARFGKLMQGTRRHNVVYANELAAEKVTDGVRVSFVLPAGSYATVLLREIMKTDLTPEPDEM